VTDSKENLMSIKYVPMIVLSCVLLGLVAGCATPAYDPAAVTGLSDSEIASDIRSRLEDDGIAGMYSFGVTVQNGIVTLQGSVPPDDAVRARIVSVAASAPGVRSVREEFYPPMVGPY
jgi:hypothetical protein